MAECILIASGKGGVGKSTATVFLGAGMAERGKKVLLIDADVGLGALDIMLRSEERTMNTWLDVENDRCTPQKAVIRISERLSLLSAPKFSVGDIDRNVFRRILSKCGNEYDMIFIDAPAGIDDGLERAAIACDKAIFVATADEISVKGAAAAASETEAFGIERENMRLLINRFVKKAALKSNLLNVDGVIDKTGVRLLGIVPEDKKIPYSSVTGVFPGEKSKFLKAVRRISARIDGENVPLVL